MSYNYVQLLSWPLIARIEHLLERMPADLQDQQRKVEESTRRLAGYKDRLGSPFRCRANWTES